MAGMANAEPIDGFGEVDITVDIDGWAATIPGGYRLSVVLVALPIVLFGALAMALGIVLARSVASVMLLAVPALLLYAAVLHTLRAVSSTRLEVQHGDIRIHRHRLGAPCGAAIRLGLVDLPMVEVTGLVGIQWLRIGEHVFPVHAARRDLDAVLRLLHESRDLAVRATSAAPAPAPAPDELRALLSAIRAQPTR